MIQKPCAGEGRSARGGGGGKCAPPKIYTTIGLHTNICLTTRALRHLQNLKNVGFSRWRFTYKYAPWLSVGAVIMMQSLYFYDAIYAH